MMAHMYCYIQYRRATTLQADGVSNSDAEDSLRPTRRYMKAAAMHRRRRRRRRYANILIEIEYFVH